MQKSIVLMIIWIFLQKYHKIFKKNPKLIKNEMKIFNKINIIHNNLKNSLIYHNSQWKYIVNNNICLNNNK